MKNMTRRIFACVLTLAIVLSMTGIMSLASESDGNTGNTVTEGGGSTDGGSTGGGSTGGGSTEGGSTDGGSTGGGSTEGGSTEGGSTGGGSTEGGSTDGGSTGGGSTDGGSTGSGSTDNTSTNNTATNNSIVGGSSILGAGTNSLTCDCGATDDNHDSSCPLYVDNTCNCGSEDDTHIEGCPLYIDNSLTCNCGAEDDTHLEGCPLYSDLGINNLECTCGTTDDNHENDCPLYTGVITDRHLSLSLEAAGEIDTGVKSGLTAVVKVSGLVEGNTYKDLSVVITLPEPLTYAGPGSTSSLNAFYDLDSILYDESLNTVTIPLKEIASSSGLVGSSGSFPIPLWVMFPPMTTPAGAGGDITAELFQNDSSISSDECQIFAKATLDWGVSKLLATSGNSTLGDEHSYRLSTPTNLGDIAKPDSDIYYMIQFRNNKLSGDGTLATQSLTFKDTLVLPEGVSVEKITLSAPDGSELNIENLTVEGPNPDYTYSAALSGDIYTISATDDNDAPVRLGAGEYTITGSWTKADSEDTLSTKQMRASLVDLKVDTSVYASINDAINAHELTEPAAELVLPAGWESTTYDLDESDPQNKTVTNIVYRAKVGNSVGGQSFPIVGDPSDLTKAEATAILYGVRVTEGGVTPPEHADIAIEKTLTSKSTSGDEDAYAVYPSATWAQDRNVTFTLGGFGNTSYAELSNFTVTDTFNHVRMAPTSINLGTYTGYTGAIKLVVEDKDNNVYSKLYSGNTGSFNFVSDLFDNESAVVPSEDIRRISLEFGDVVKGFAVTTAPTISFVTKNPEQWVQGDDDDKTKAGIYTVANNVALSAETKNGTVGDDDQATYNVRVKGDIQVGDGKNVDLGQANPGDWLTYTLYITNDSNSTMVGPINFTDFLPFNDADKEQYLDNFVIDIDGVTGYDDPEASPKGTGYYLGDIKLNGKAVDSSVIFQSEDAFKVANPGVGIDMTPGTVGFTGDSQVKVNWTFGTDAHETILLPGQMLAIRFKVHVKDDAPEVDLTNKFSYTYKYQPGAPGPGGPGEPGSGSGEYGNNGEVKTQIIAKAAQISIFKATDRTASARTVSDSFAGGKTNSEYIDVFSTTGDVAEADLPLLSGNSGYDKLPTYAPGNIVTFSLIAKNTGDVAVDKFLITDPLAIDFDNTNTKILKSYFEYDEVTKKLKITDFEFAIFDDQGSQLNSWTVGSYGTKAKADDNAGYTIWMSAENQISIYYVGNGSAEYPTLESGYQLQVRYNVKVRSDVTNPLVKVKNDVRFYSIRTFKPNNATVVGERYNELTAPSSKGNGRYYNVTGADSKSNVCRIDSRAYLAIADDGNQQVGLSKSAVFSDAKNGWVDHRVKLDSASGWLREQQIYKPKGAYFTYEITITNYTNGVIKAGSLELVDILPPGQKAYNKDNTTAIDTIYTTSNLSASGTYTNGKTAETTYVSELPGSAGQLNAIKFTNPKDIAKGGKLTIYYRAVVEDVDALVEYLKTTTPYTTLNKNTNKSYNEGSQFSFDNFVYLNITNKSWGAYTGTKVTNPTNSYNGSKIPDGEYIRANAEIYYQKDEIIPGIQKTITDPTTGAAISTSNKGDYVAFTVTLTNDSANQAMSNYRLVDYLDSGYQLNAGSFTYELNGQTLNTVDSDPLAPTLNQSAVTGYTKLEWSFGDGFELKKNDSLVIRYTAIVQSEGGHPKNHALLLPGTTFLGDKNSKGSKLTLPLDSNAAVKDQSPTLLEHLATHLDTYPGLWTSVQTSVMSVPGLATEKGVRADATGNGSFTYNRNEGTPYVYQNPGELVRFQLNIENTSSSKMTLQKVLDVLPHLKDTGVYLITDSRGSKFALTLPDDIDLTLSDGSASYNVTYGNTKTNADDSEKWALSDTDSEGKNALLIDFTDGGYELAGGKTLTIEFNALVPSAKLVNDPNSDKLLNGIAWNSFAVAVLQRDQTTGYTEPLRVGVETTLSTLTVQKTVDGSKEGDLTGFTFRLTEIGDDGSAVDSITSTTGADGTAFFGNLLPGRQYKLEELDRDGYVLDTMRVTQGSIALEGDDVVTFTTDEDEAEELLITANNLVNHGSLTVHKRFTDSSNRSPANFRFTLRDSDNNLVAQLSTDSNGTVRFDDLAPGTYTLREESRTNYTFSRWYYQGQYVVTGTLTVEITGKSNVSVIAYNRYNGGGGGSGSGDGGGGGGGGGSYTYLNDDPIPLGNLTTILDDDIPLGNIPNPYTGDGRQIPVAAFLAALSGAACILSYRFLFNKKEG